MKAFIRTASRGAGSIMDEEGQQGGCFGPPAFAASTGGLEIPAPVKRLFRELAENGVMTPAALLRFFVEQQHEEGTWNQERVAALIDDVNASQQQRQLASANAAARAVSCGYSVLMRSSAVLFSTRWRTLGGALEWNPKSLSLASFLQMLLEPSVTRPIDDKVSQDMSRPLSHYFFFTSHNTYLTGNQLTSTSSIEPIVHALQLGVRVVELDLWPSSDRMEILVTHGGTLTKPVAFAPCIEAVKRHAFDASEFPVILTLEDHLPANLQAKAAEVLTAVLGATLYTPADDAPMAAFPPLGSLMRRVLVSTQPPPAPSDAPDALGAQAHSGSTSARLLQVAELPGSPASPGTPPRTPSPLDVGRGAPPGVVAPVAAEEPPAGGGAGGSPVAVPGEGLADGSGRLVLDVPLDASFRQLIAIRGGRVKGEPPRAALLAGFGPAVKRISLSEGRFEALAKSDPQTLVRYTQRNIIRIFPKALRVQSSNYNPVLGWTYGAQMVAANMQGHGRSLSLHFGLFSGNGRCGYVLKPDFLLAGPPEGLPPPDPSPRAEKSRSRKHRKSQEAAAADVGVAPPRSSEDAAAAEGTTPFSSGELGAPPTGGVFDPRAPRPPRLILKVAVLLGSKWHRGDDSSRRAAEYGCELSTWGVPADIHRKQKTEASKTVGLGRLPQWEDEEKEFVLTVPELALLRIKVVRLAKVNSFFGQAVLPVHFLRRGFRTLPLLDKSCQDLGGPQLLCHISLAVPDANHAQSS